MAIAHNSTTSNKSSSASSLTISHTPAGTDKVMIAWMMYKGTTDTEVSGVTFNTTETFTRFGGADDGATCIVECWYLINPTTTTANTVISLSTTRMCVGIVSTYTGVHQTTMWVGSPFTATGSGTTGTVDATGVLSTSLVVDGMCFNIGAPLTATVGSGQTERDNQLITGSGSDILGASSDESGTGTITMSWGASKSTAWSTIAGELAIAGAAPSGGALSGSLSLLGVGI